MEELTRARKVPGTEAKLRLLYLLDRLGCATREQLWVLVARLNIMEYIPCCEALQALCKTEALWAPNGLDGMLALSAEGYDLLQTLLLQMPHSERMHMDRAAQEYRHTLDEEQSCIVYHEAPKDGLHAVRCTVGDSGEKLMELRISGPDAAVINAAADGFRTRAAQLLRKCYLLPIAEAQAVPDCAAADALHTALQHPWQPYVTEEGGQFSGVVCLACGQSEKLSIRLWESDRRQACAFAAAAAKGGEPLAKEMLALLCAPAAKEGTPTA